MSPQKKVVWLASFSHFITHGYMTLFPAVMVVIAAENSMSFMAIGIVANIGYFLYGLGAFPAGWLADKYGSKRVLTIGVIGMALSAILVSLSSQAWTFGVSYAILGTFASIHHPAGLSLIARRVTENKGQALGVHGVMGNVGLFLTPLFAALCIHLFQSWRASYLLYGCVGIFFAVLLQKARIPEEGDLSFAAFGKKTAQKVKEPEEEQPAPVSQPQTPAVPGTVVFIPLALILLYLGSVCSGYIFRGSLTFFPALFRQEVLSITNHDQPVVMAGYLTTAVLFVGLVGAWFGGWINDKLKRPELFPAMVFVLVTPLLYLISSSSDNRLITVSVFFSLVYYAWQPAQNYLISKYTKKASHGKGFGVNFFLIFGIGSVATASGGYVADEFGVDRFYFIMSLVSAVTVVAASLVYLVRKYQLRFSCALEKEK